MQERVPINSTAASRINCFKICSSVDSEELNSYIPTSRHIEVDLPSHCNAQVLVSNLKGQCHEIFDPGFFSSIDYHPKLFSNSVSNSPRYSF
jgi:hypothetical protein